MMTKTQATFSEIASRGTTLQPPVTLKLHDLQESLDALVPDRREIVEDMQRLGWEASCFGVKRWWRFTKTHGDKLEVRQGDITARWMENVSRCREQDLDDAIRLAFRKWRDRL